MKKFIYMSATMLSALALTTACSNEAEEATAVENQETFTITATMEAPTTRTTVAIEESEAVNNVYPVYWTDGDQFYVWGFGSSVVSATFSLTERNEDKQTGTFISKLSATNLQKLQWAAYPTVHVNGSNMYVYLPDSYTYSSAGNETKAPMYALFNSSDWTNSHSNTFAPWYACVSKVTPPEKT